MEFLLIAFIVLSYLFFSRKRGGDTEYSSTPPLAFNESIKRIEESWSPEQLNSVFFQEVCKWPQYEPFLTQAYQLQKEILLGILSNNSYHIQIVREKILASIKLAKSAYEIQMLKFSLRWVLQKIPHFNLLFNSPTYSSPKKSKDLFGCCKTIGEVKRRLRRLALLNHPDKGGSEAAMKEILKQYEETLSKL